MRPTSILVVKRIRDATRPHRLFQDTLGPGRLTSAAGRKVGHSFLAGFRPGDSRLLPGGGEPAFALFYPRIREPIRAADVPPRVLPFNLNPGTDDGRVLVNMDLFCFDLDRFDLQFARGEIVQVLLAILQNAAGADEQEISVKKGSICAGLLVSTAAAQSASNFSSSFPTATWAKTAVLSVAGSQGTPASVTPTRRDRIASELIFTTSSGFA